MTRHADIQPDQPAPVPGTGGPPRIAVGAPGAGRRAGAWALWGAYVLIVLEILFMVSPVAAYYYAAYGLPLNALQNRPGTAWLTQHILPHFSASDSPLVNGLIVLAWPLIGLGLVLFLVGFVQIYRARFRGRGAVATGLYRSIRHPQYVALALMGLGTTLVWPRFLVLVAFVVMLSAYAWLARLEERRCLARFGGEYQRYLQRTGRFLPRRLEQRLARWLPWPRSPARQRALAVALTVLAVAGSVWLGAMLRQHAIDSLQVAAHGSHTLLFLAPLGDMERQQVAGLLDDVLGTEARLVYLAPDTWSIPELGLLADSGYHHDGAQELSRPATHGNAGGYRDGLVRALITRPRLVRPVSAGRPTLAAAVGVDGEWLVDLDLTAGAAMPPRAAGPTLWPGVPVPVF